MTTLSVFCDAQNISTKQPVIESLIAFFQGRYTKINFFIFPSKNASQNLPQQIGQAKITYITLQHYIKGKNSADIAIVTEAMHAYSQNQEQDFCILSSDSDYSYLINFLRNLGRKVFGVGNPEQCIPKVKKLYTKFYPLRHFQTSKKLLPESDITFEWRHQEFKIKSKHIVLVNRERAIRANILSDLLARQYTAAERIEYFGFKRLTCEHLEKLGFEIVRHQKQILVKI